MDTAPLLLELYGRIPPLAAGAVEGLDRDQLCRAPEPGANTIGWLVWHLARVQDHHVSELLETEQIWAGGDWARAAGSSPIRPTRATATAPRRFEPCGPRARTCCSATCDAVDARTKTMLESLAPGDLDRVVDKPLGPAGHAGGASRQHRRRQLATRGAGGLRAGPARRLSCGQRAGGLGQRTYSA